MAIKNYLIFFFIFLFAGGYCQELTGTIRGKVTDKQSGFEIPGVNISVTSVEPIQGGASDVFGNFRVENIPVGRHTIRVSLIGYETVTLSNLMLTSAKELEVNIALEESIVNLETVTISAQGDKKESINKMATVSSRTFSVEEAARYSGALQDPARMAQNFAGVNGSNDSRNDIIIRGNSPTGVLWRLEGIDIPSPNHFATLGTTGGPISMLNINNISNSDFATSAFAAEYGNALSGVFDLNLRAGNSEKKEYLAQVGFNGFELGAEGPFKKGNRGSYLANYRYSTLGVFHALGVDLGTGAAVPEYQDVTFKINGFTRNNIALSLFGIGGISSIEFLAKDAGSNNLFTRDLEDTRFTSETGILGVSAKKFLDKNTSIKLILSGSHVATKGIIEKVDSLFQPLYTDYAFSQLQDKLSSHLRFNKKVNASNTYIIGAIYDHLFFDVTDSIYENGNYRIASDSKENTSLSQVYAQWQHKFSGLFKMNLGLHSQNFHFNSSFILEPRLGLKYSLTEKQTLSFGYGLHSQTQPITVYFERDQLAGNNLPNKNLDFSKSHHIVLAHDWFFSESMRLKSEIYYQHLFDVPVDSFASTYSMLNEGADFGIASGTGILNNGTGRNYGLEITLEHFFNKGYYFLFTSSLFEAKYKGSDGVERNSVYNTNYVFNALGGKEFNILKNTTLSFDSKVTYTGGRRYSPIDYALSAQFNRDIRDNTRAFSLQYDPYFRLDFKITFRRNGKKTSQQFAVDLQNITGNKNIFLQEYNPTTKQVETTYQRGFFPDVQYKIYF